MTDVMVISSRLGPIAEAGKNIAKLQTLVKDKSIPRKNVSQAMAGLLKRSSSKKDVEQDETIVEPTAEKDDGDEDGESLGILTKEQATDQEAQTAGDAEQAAATTTSIIEPSSSERVETPAASTEEVAAPTVESASEPTETPAAPDAPAPTTPSKDDVIETERLEAAEEDEPTVTETLAAPPVEEKELPVEPVSPVDQDIDINAKDDGKLSEDAPPTLPNKDAKSDGPNAAVGKTIEEKEEVPDVPTKTD